MRVLETAPRSDFLFTRNYQLYLETILAGLTGNALMILEPGDCTRYEFLIIQLPERWIVGSIGEGWLRSIGCSGILVPGYLAHYVKINSVAIYLLCDLVNQIRGLGPWTYYQWRE